MVWPNFYNEIISSELELALSAHILFSWKTENYLFFGFALVKTVIKKSNFLKSLSRVEIFENAGVLFLSMISVQ